MSLLNEAHWSPAKKSSIALYEAAYREEQLSLHSAAKRFLERFGGIIVKYSTPDDQLDVLDLCANDAVQGMGDGGLIQLERELSVHPLCPLGHFDDGTCLLVQDRLGRVYGISDELLIRAGESGEDAVNNILTGIEMPIIRSNIRRRH